MSSVVILLRAGDSADVPFTILAANGRDRENLTGKAVVFEAGALLLRNAEAGGSIAELEVTRPLEGEGFIRIPKDTFLASGSSTPFTLRVRWDVTKQKTPIAGVVRVA